jgi:hypothetical protein
LCSHALREPLVHFLALGGLLFVAYAALIGERPDSSQPDSRLIVVTPGQVDALIATYTRTWQHAPDAKELKVQLDDFIREEIATREAMAMGLDRSDTVVRRRLRQKLESLVVDITVDSEASDAELQGWLDAHADNFRREPQIAFRQVYLSPTKRGASLAEDAAALREQLAGAGPDADIERLGDPLMAPVEVPLARTSDVTRQFGVEFARQVLRLAPGRWAGPIQSSYGLHIVLVRRRVEGRTPALAEVRPQVERLFAAERRQRKIEEMYSTLLAKYRVVIEPRSIGAQ